MKDFILLQTCFGGGTGRRAGFKIQFWQQSVGSIPTRSTNFLLQIKNFILFVIYKLHIIKSLNFTYLDLSYKLRLIICIHLHYEAIKI